jgi:hypothetical protein
MLIRSHKPPQRRNALNIARFSKRKMAFLLFDEQQGPLAVTFMVGIPYETVMRYYRGWKKLPKFHNQVYLVVRQMMRRMSTEEKTVVYEELANELGCEVDEIEQRMTLPWALRDLVTQQWRQWDVTKTQIDKAGYSLRRVVGKFTHRSDDAEYIIKIAKGEQSPQR